MRSRQTEQGQILVIFAGALIAIVAVAGLVIDGGRAFALRRQGQNVADVAALAGATAYLNATGAHETRAAVARGAAVRVAEANGYVAGRSATTLSVTVALLAGGATVRVDVVRPQENYFASLLGQPTWYVGSTATAMSSDSPNGARGAMAVIFNEELWLPGGLDPNAEMSFDLPDPGSEDVPQDPDQFNWTIYCTASGNPCNANSAGVRAIIDGFGETKTIYLNDDIGPMNAGAHTTLFDALAQHVGKDTPVGVVDDEGRLQGWAMFHLTASTGGSTKQIRGYFVSPINAPPLEVGAGGGAGSAVFGAYVVKLID